MAKFDDYKHLSVQDSDLDQEIEQAANRTQEKDNEENIPERFRGKSKEDVIKSFLELEQLGSRHSNELGQLRQTVQSLNEKLDSSNKQPTREVSPVTLDALYDDADGSIRRVAKEESSAVASRVDELEKQLQESRQLAAIAEARGRFESKHSNYKEVLAESDFIDWVKASPMRVQMAQAADSGNFEAADELFSTYGEIKKLKSKPAPKTEAARKVSLERSGGASPAPETAFSRHELQEKRIAAQRGDRTAARWLQSNDAAIRAAYEENRLTT